MGGFNIMDKIKERAIKSAVPMIEDAIEDYLPKILEAKNKTPLIGNEKDIVVLLFESNGKAYMTLATISNESQIKRHLWTKPISEVLTMITES